MKGRIFDIKRFAVHDGDGVRTTVFFKGCPLRCEWCHNPEGQSSEIETMTRLTGEKVVCGRDWTAGELAEELLRNADIMAQSGGGVTFSGGEPLAQADFLLELIPLLKAKGVSLAIETSGYAEPAVYRAVVRHLDFVYQDLKHHDSDAFRELCGGDLRLVLANLEWLRSAGIPFAVRVPCIPGANDSPKDRELLLALAGASPFMTGVEFLPYVSPVAKRRMLGRA